MKIDLRSRLLPFSHLPGIECMVPFSDHVIQIFPTVLRFGQKEIPLNINGPVKNFTVIQNLEKGEIAVFGETATELLRYILIFVENEVQMVVRKPLQPFFKETVSKTAISSSKERLHLGLHKALDWELVKRRFDLKEILPVWHRLGQLTSDVAYIPDHSLFYECREALTNRKKSTIFTALKNLFAAGFQGIMVPRVKDLEYQGYELPPIEKNPLALLSEGANLIRSLFLSVSQDEIELLPVLPSEFVSGKLCCFHSSNAEIDLEWSKRVPRRMVIKASKSFSSTVIFPKNVLQARLRLKDNDKGVMVKSRTLLHFEQGVHYFFDKFAN